MAISIIPQNLKTVNGFDFTVSYNSTGNATVSYGLFNDDQCMMQGSFDVNKEFTDGWLHDDQIVSLISQHSGIELTLQAVEHE